MNIKNGVDIELPEHSKIVSMDRKSILLEEQNAKGVSGINPEELIFALDIGTRTVIGLAGVAEEDGFRVLAAEVMEHGNRAMLDGQIHDIAKVCQIVENVKESIENKLGIELSKVSIAAAGRVLLTCQVKVERGIEEGQEIDSDVVNALDMECIQKAQEYLEAEILQSERSQFYCVGYSVVNYYLNDFPISELIGHKGYKIAADMLATFLPHVVVDSLYTVMDRVGLEISNLTLEPIAAINVAIPKDLRLLNLALVDVGAGTSDIAITRSGTVTAYAMVPVAGDEITETIARHYLVDFNMAEKIKLSMKDRKTPITFTDILDNQITVAYDEVYEAIGPVVRQLAESIAEKILEYNGGKPPNAVFLVGGGSQTPGLCGVLSELLGLPAERVAVRNRSIAKNVIYDGENLNGPECITPFGIMVTTALQQGQDFFHVTVNGKKVKLFNSRKMTVSDALILLGYTPDQLIGKTGKPLRFTLNGQSKTIRGSFGNPAEIVVNGNTANLGTVLKIGDEVKVKEAVNGQDAVLKAGDLRHSISPLTVQMYDEIYNMPQRLILNGEPVEPDIPVRDGDDLQISSSYFISEIIHKFELNTDEYIVLIDGNESTEDSKVDSTNQIRIVKKQKLEDKLDIENLDDNKNVEEDPLDDFDLPDKKEEETIRNGFSVTVNGKGILLEQKKKSYMFVDIFNYIDFDISKPQGTIVLKLNGKKAGFTDPIQAGDSIEIYWEK